MPVVHYADTYWNGNWYCKCKKQLYQVLGAVVTIGNAFDYLYYCPNCHKFFEKHSGLDYLEDETHAVEFLMRERGFVPKVDDLHRCVTFVKPPLGVVAEPDRWDLI
jgi:hypothetical protein